MTGPRQTNNKAEEHRRRRSTRASTSSQAAFPSRVRKTSQHKEPPVVARRVAVPGPVKNSSAKRTKRRLDVSLGSSGAEMRLPSIPIVHFGWRLFSGSLLAVLLFSVYTLWNSPTYRVVLAEVEGLERLTGEDINAVARVYDRPIFTIEPEKIRKELVLAFPELSSVVVEIGIPDQVKVTIEERIPLISWRQGEQTLWIDEEGVAFPPRGEAGSLVIVEAGDSPETPNIDEDPLQDGAATRFLAMEMVHAILAMNEVAPGDTPVVYTPVHGLGWRDERGWDVYFGKFDGEMDMKLNLYEAIVSHLEQSHVHPRLISVEYLHAPYYRLEN
jgi:cell division protein FtsQ